MEQAFDQIRRYIDKHRKPMLSLWEELVNTESGSRQLEGVEAVCNILRRELEGAGVKTRTIPMDNAGSVLVGEWDNGSTKAPLLFIGHMDTVFKEGAVKENPFRVDEENFAHGPGVVDMKAGLVIAVYAIKALAELGFHERPIKCVFAGDEENLHMFSNAKAVMEAEASGALAAFNFETGYLDNHFVVGRNGGGPAQITVHGVAAHSGLAPEKGRSAILEAAHKIAAIEALNDIPRGKLINCGKVSGGIGENTIPDTCTINLGIRFPTSEIKGEILTALQSIVEHICRTGYQPPDELHGYDGWCYGLVRTCEKNRSGLRLWRRGLFPCRQPFRFRHYCRLWSTHSMRHGGARRKKPYTRGACRSGIPVPALYACRLRGLHITG